MTIFWPVYIHACASIFLHLPACKHLTSTCGRGSVWCAWARGPFPAESQRDIGDEVNNFFFVMDRCSLPSFELSPADSVGPRWERWLARFENYLMASKIAGDDRQKAQYYCMSQEATNSISTQRWQYGLTRPMLRRPPSRGISLLGGTGSLRFFGFRYLLDS